MPAIRGAKSKKKTRRYTRDVDQIHADLHDKRHLERYKETKVAEDLPGLGQWYCVECAKWFDAEPNYLSHKKGSTHKRRLVFATLAISNTVLYNWFSANDERVFHGDFMQPPFGFLRQPCDWGN